MKCHERSTRAVQTACVVVFFVASCLSLVPANAMTQTSATAGDADASRDDPIARLGKRLHAILRPLRSIENSSSAVERQRVLRASLGALQTLRSDLRNLPAAHASARDRIAFHLDFLIKWNRYLLEKSGGAIERDADAARRREADRYRAALRRLEAAKAYARRHPADRSAIADRYLAALKGLRGTPEERWILERLNRLWAEIVTDGGDDGARDAPSVTEQDPGQTHAPDPGLGSDPAIPATGTLDAAALKTLRTTLQSGATEERIAAARRLATQTKGWVSTFLVTRLERETDPSVGAVLVEIVGQRGDRKTMRALGRWARLDDPARRMLAIDLISRIDHKDVGKTLVGFCKDQDAAVVARLIEAAKIVDDGGGVRVLAELMKRRPQLRGTIIAALGDVRDPASAKVLLSFLHRRKYMEFKSPTMKSLRALGVHAIPTLIAALDARDYRQYAASALRTITGRPHGVSRTLWERWWRRNRARLEAEEAARQPKAEPEGKPR